MPTTLTERLHVIRYDYSRTSAKDLGADMLVGDVDYFTLDHNDDQDQEDSGETISLAIRMRVFNNSRRRGRCFRHRWRILTAF